MKKKNDYGRKQDHLRANTFVGLCQLQHLRTIHSEPSVSAKSHIIVDIKDEKIAQIFYFFPPADQSKPITGWRDLLEQLWQFSSWTLTSKIQKGSQKRYLILIHDYFNFAKSGQTHFAKNQIQRSLRNRFCLHNDLFRLFLIKIVSACLLVRYDTYRSVPPR